MCLLVAGNLLKLLRLIQYAMNPLVKKALILFFQVPLLHNDKDLKASEMPKVSHQSTQISKSVSGQNVIMKSSCC